jgi:hypothetical protein
MEDISFYLQKDIHNCGNGELNDLLETAFMETAHDINWTPNINYVSHKLKSFVKEQGKIGWYQLYNGRVAKTIADFMEDHFCSLELDPFKYTGKRWTKMLIRTVWNTILKLWKSRNDIIYNQDRAETERVIWENLQQRVEHCYNQAESLPAADRNLIFQRDINELLQEDN